MNDSPSGIYTLDEIDRYLKYTKSMTDQLPRIYTLDEVAQYLKKSTRTVRRMIARGELEAIDRGRRVTENQLKRYIDTEEERCLNSRASGSSSSSGRVPEARSTSAGTTQLPDKQSGLQLARLISRRRKPSSQSTSSATSAHKGCSTHLSQTA
jgi:excisionase family DNA binding protein